MKKRISDLLDDYREDTVNLEYSAPLSSDRIKELTMSKINHKEKKGKRMGFRVLVVAAIISMLAVTAFAAGNAGSWFRSFFAGNSGEELSDGQISFIEENAKDGNQGDTIGSYHVALDSFISDGNASYVKIAVQAVDGAEMPDENYSFREMDVLTQEGENVAVGITWAMETIDLEGSTAYYLLSFDCLSLPEQIGDAKTVIIKLQDLCKGGLLIAEGEWKYEIELPDVSLELLSEPVSGFTVFDDDGNELDVMVTSVVFRPMGVTVKYGPVSNTEHHPGAAKAVMKDGTVKDLLPGAWGRESDAPDALHWVEYYGGLIATGEVDYIELPGGIQLAVNAE